jgi:hypothetical protein
MTSFDPKSNIHIHDDGHIEMHNAKPPTSLSSSEDSHLEWWNNMSYGSRIAFLLFVGPIILLLLLLTPIPGIDEFFGFVVIIGALVHSIYHFFASMSSPNTNQQYGTNSLAQYKNTSFGVILLCIAILIIIFVIGMSLTT